MQSSFWFSWLHVAGWAITVVFLFHMIPIVWRSCFPRLLARASDKGPDEATWLEVTIVVAARNEATAIRESLTSLVKLDYPCLKIVAVDDRSTDATGAIMDELAMRNPRLHVIHVAELPAGWLGKNHANWVGAACTSSPWILFTDGDVVFYPNCLRQAIRHVRAERVDHLAMIPEMIRGGFWENLIIFTFSMLFRIRYKPWLVRTRWKWFYIGIGAFNLISRQAYEAIGTHRRLAMEAVDDLKLGKLVKRHQLRQDVLDGRELFHVRWQVGLRGVIRGLEKNAFASFDYSLWRAAVENLAFVLVFLSPYAFAVLLNSPARWGFVAALVAWHGAFGIVAWRENYSPLLSLLLPLALVLFEFAVWRSIAITLRRGGISWRETFYPLNELRKGVV